MEYIGGFFELETDFSGAGTEIHPDALPLNYGRSCFSYILREISPARVYVPYYTCDSLLEPLISGSIDFKFYKIDETLDIQDQVGLNANEYLVYINYFGLKSAEVSRLLKKYGKNLIVDNTQAFFYKPSSPQWSFNSARKFFGVPDGAFLYSFGKTDGSFERNREISMEHLRFRKEGRQEEAYRSFLAYENSIRGTIKKISEESEQILRGINLEKASTIRRQNFKYYHEQLKEYNCLKPELGDQVPMCYPFMPLKPLKKTFFYEEGIFIPSFWNDVLLRGRSGFAMEEHISENLLPLPLDHRYGTGQCEKVMEIIRKLY